MGGSVSEDCNSAVYRIWKWFQDRNTWLTVVVVNGREKNDAGRQSRKVCDNMFQEGNCCVANLLASRLNYQISNRLSGHRDLEASESCLLHQI